MNFTTPPTVAPGSADFHRAGNINAVAAMRRHFAAFYPGHETAASVIAALLAVGKDKKETFSPIFTRQKLPFLLFSRCWQVLIHKPDRIVHFFRAVRSGLSLEKNPTFLPGPLDIRICPGYHSSQKAGGGTRDSRW